MNNQLYIPQRIKVGFQERGDTYTKKLAYIICYGADGKLRKEVSFEGWRDKKIDTMELDNAPHHEFILNKNIERYRWSHFSSGRSYIRVYDSRGIEFEVTPENLIGILMHCDCNKRALSGKYVYAWSGKDLVLLPCDSEEYEAAKNFTSLQHKKIVTKDLVPGCSYKTKKQEDVIYVGRFMWYEAVLYGRKGPKPRTGKKHHIFTNDGKKFYYKTNLEFLAHKNSEDIVGNYAEIIENFQNNIHSVDIIDIRAIPATIEAEIVNPSPQWGWSYDRLKRNTYYKIENGFVKEFTVEHESSRHPDYKVLGYKIISRHYSDWSYDISGKTLRTQDRAYYSYREPEILSLEKLLNLGLCDLEVTTETGKKIIVKDNLYSLLT